MRTLTAGALSRWGRYLVVPLVMWLGVVAALAGGLAWVQHRSEQEFQHRFALRATIGADFVANYAADLLVRARRQGEAFLTGASIGEAQLRAASTPFGYTAVVLLDGRGRLLQVVPARPALLGTDLSGRYEHLRTAVRDGVPAVSRVVPSAAQGVPVVAFAVPFDTPAGRRVFSGALKVQDSPLGAYLTHAIALPSSQVQLIDPDGKVVASNRPLGTLAGADDRPLTAALARAASGEYRDSSGLNWFYSAEPVAGTPWRIVAAVPTSVMYAPARSPGAWRAIIVMVVAVAGLAAVAGTARSRRSRELLRESELRFQEVFDNSLIGMAITAPTTRILRVNPAFCTMLGHPESRLLARTSTDITHPDDRDRATAAISDTLTGRSHGFSTEERYLHADGHTVDALVTTSLIRDDTGAPLHFATQIVDITERKALEAIQDATNTQLRQAHERVADLVGMLSHDVRQPLGVITAYTDTVIEDWDTLADARRRDFLARISAAARRMAVLVEDVLALTNLDAGTIEPRRATVDVVGAIADAITQLPPEQTDAIAVQQPARPAYAVVDPGHLQQILLNLLGNALKYGEPPIDVTITTTGDSVDVIVADHGEGVPEDFVPRLFKRFARATTGAAVAKKGTGLGLYIVEQLARANHARISYQPNQPHGSRFTLCLTAAPPPEDLPSPALTSGAQNR